MPSFVGFLTKNSRFSRFLMAKMTQFFPFLGILSRFNVPGSV
jgi:hypothetical protein